MGGTRKTDESVSTPLVRKSENQINTPDKTSNKLNTGSIATFGFGGLNLAGEDIGHVDAVELLIGDLRPIS
ncbi:hypothetical protein Pla100_36400 [Neorhodopirellula pilleata]|uniref:Uncharacterized protein n=1 Tax=Neorhodopirellula pilleata TaxID=2714738 RepID=A0A5C6A6B3_9BACT|nr:hypothetical protein Pla100_36400 [Neorhodopirellula pilleata]